LRTDGNRVGRITMDGSAGMCCPWRRLAHQHCRRPVACLVRAAARWAASTRTAPSTVPLADGARRGPVRLDRQPRSGWATASGSPRALAATATSSSDHRRSLSGSRAAPAKLLLRVIFAVPRHMADSRSRQGPEAPTPAGHVRHDKAAAPSRMGGGYGPPCSPRAC
jgi:hypothetical protein